MVKNRSKAATSDIRSEQPGCRNRTRPTVGVFLGQMEERYQSIIWPGIVDAAQELDLNLIFFPGAPLDVPHDVYAYMSERNKVYSLAHSTNLDGLVLFSGTLAGFVDLESLYRFYDRFRDLPIVSLALPLEGASNILVDNKRGMYELVSHLIEVHGYRHLAFIRGPEGHPEAEERFQAYVEALAAHQIAFDPELIVTAQFSAATSSKAIPKLLDKENIHFDAIVSANDRMAVGALDALQERGWQIPKDVAVTGFDDIEESRYTVSPLTTVRQPLYTQGRKAIELLYKQLMGDKRLETVALPTELIIRQSCGCTLSQAIMRQSPEPEKNSESDSTNLSDRREHIVAEMVRSGTASRIDQPVKIDVKWAGTLFDAFMLELQGGTPDHFLTVLEELLSQVLQTQGSITGWKEMILSMRWQVRPYLKDPKTLEQADKLWRYAQTIIGEVAERAQAYNRYQTLLRALQISDTSQALLSTFEVGKLMDTICQYLPELGIKSCFVVLYDESGEPSDQARLVLAFEDRERFELPSDGLLFPTRQLVPDALPLDDRQRTWLLAPLHFQADHLGYIVMGIGPRDGMVYETIRRYVSSALKGTLLLQERLKAENELRQYHDFLEERVSERTNELHEANIQLQREIAERKLAEAEVRKLNEELEERVRQRTSQLEAANQDLESFTYSVSHDLRAPLRAIIGFTAILLNDFMDQLPSDAQEHLKRVDKNAHQMHQLVLDLLAFSRLGRKEILKRSVDCTDLAHNVYAELSEEWSDRTVEIEITDMPACLADPALLKQVFINLISNALKFTRIRETARIQIFSEQINGKNVYVVKDNGVGFDLRYQDKLFGVFQRLHGSNAYEGSGVGLAIVKRIITRHGGQIWAEAEVERGATFYFTLE